MPTPRAESRICVLPCDKSSAGLYQSVSAVRGLWIIIGGQGSGRPMPSQRGGIYALGG